MILVLGAGGTVGRALCRQLDERNAEYRAAYRSGDKLEAALEEGQEAVAVDLRRPQTLRAAMEDVSRLFLLTAATPDLAELERNAILAAQRAGVDYVVKLSVWEADAAAYDFARWHAPAEAALAESGIAHCLLRPNGFMQSQAEAMAPTVRNHGAFYVPNLKSRAAYVDAGDVAACAAALLVDDPPVPERAVWSLTGAESFDALELAECLGRAIHKPVRAVEVTEAAWREGLLAAGLPEWQADALVDMARQQAEGGFGRTTDDIETLLGRPPRSFEAFLSERREAFIG